MIGKAIRYIVILFLLSLLSYGHYVEIHFLARRLSALYEPITYSIVWTFSLIFIAVFWFTFWDFAVNDRFFNWDGRYDDYPVSAILWSLPKYAGFVLSYVGLLLASYLPIWNIAQFKIWLFSLEIAPALILGLLTWILVFTAIFKLLDLSWKISKD